MTSHSLEAVNLTKTYGSFVALSSLNLKIEGSKCVGFLGPNGAGKTTTLKIFTDLIRPSSGQALINQPELLLLDEPTTGLDPQARHLVWERLYQLKSQGVTLVLTTHYMDEAEQLCDRLVIMDGGRIVAEGSPRALINEHSTREVVEIRYRTHEDREAAMPGLKELGDRLEILPDRVLIYTADGDDIEERVLADRPEPAATLVRRSTLEDVFLTLTGRTLED